MSKPLTFGSLFAGIGGFDLGFERAGMVCKWQVEIDPWCQKVLAKHWPDVKRYGDIKQLTGHELERVDVLCGGFPCQPHSLAGKRLASADDRDLWGEFTRLIRILEPRWVVAENVIGLLSSETGRFFGRVLRDLAASGYDAEWDVLPAAAFGAPHIRERVLIVGYRQTTTDSRTGRIGFLADASVGGQWGNQDKQDGPAQQNKFADSERSGIEMADAKRHGQRAGLCKSVAAGKRRRRPIDGCSAVIFSNANVGISDGRTDESRRQAQERETISRDCWWITEPDVGRVAHGVPARVDRLRGLGNAIVPQVAEFIGSRIVEAANE